MFGSYLTNSDDLGEIDLAIKMEQRPASGSFSDAYPERLVALLLKGGSRYISLHGVAEPGRCHAGSHVRHDPRTVRLLRVVVDGG